MKKYHSKEGRRYIAYALNFVLGYLASRPGTETLQDVAKRAQKIVAKKSNGGRPKGSKNRKS